jgi:hypothetical protein
MDEVERFGQASTEVARLLQSGYNQEDLPKADDHARLEIVESLIGCAFIVVYNGEKFVARVHPVSSSVLGGESPPKVGAKHRKE